MGTLGLPVARAVGLAAHQQLSPGWQQQLAFTLTVATSYEGAAALRAFAGLKAGRGRAGQVIRREQNYFAEHAGRMNYRTMARRGWPIGSGSVESACLQRQGRFKRGGQFWTPRGLQRLCALIETRQNGHSDALWNQ